MAYVINPIDINSRTILKQTQRKLSCMPEYLKPECFKTKIHDADEIERRINEAAKERARLDFEIKKRYENIKHINFMG